MKVKLDKRVNKIILLTTFICWVNRVVQFIYYYHFDKKKKNQKTESNPMGGEEESNKGGAGVGAF